MKSIGYLVLFLMAWVVNSIPLAPQHKEKYSLRVHAGDKPLEIDLWELRDAMKDALSHTRDAINIANAHSVLLFRNDASLMQQILDAYESGNSEMTQIHLNFFREFYLIPEEEIPPLAKVTVDGFERAIANCTIEVEKIVNNAGVHSEIIEQVKAVDSVLNSATTAAIQPVLAIIRNADK